MSHPFTSITVRDLALLMADPPADLQLIDVREPSEQEIASLPGFQSFPLSEFEIWQGKIVQCLKPEAETVVLCHHGVRSAHMCQWLSQQGFTHLKNVTGGIDAYSILVDAAVPRY